MDLVRNFQAGGVLSRYLVALIRIPRRLNDCRDFKIVNKEIFQCTQCFTAVMRNVIFLLH